MKVRHMDILNTSLNVRMKIKESHDLFKTAPSFYVKTRGINSIKVLKSIFSEF